MDLPLVTELGAISAAIAAVILFLSQLKRIWGWLKSSYLWFKRVFLTYEQVSKNRDAIKRLEETVSTGFESVETKLGVILDEVQTNGPGSSLKKVLRHEREVRWREYDLQGKAIWETARLPNGEFGCVRASLPLEELVGTSPLGIGWMTTLHEDDAAIVEDRWNDAIKYGHPYQQLQRFVVRDGEGRVKQINYVRAFFKPEYDGDTGEFIGGLGQLFPITEEEYFERVADV